MANGIDPRTFLRALGCALALNAACAGEAEPAMDADGGAGTGGGASGGKGGAGAHANAGSGGHGSNGGTGGANAGAAGHAAGTSGSGGAGGRDAGSGGSTGSGGAGHAATAECDAVATSAPPATWTNVTGMLAGLESECGNLTLVAADPCKDRVIAGVAKRGLYATSDRGANWTKLGSGNGSADIVHRPASIVFDPEHPDVIYESGIYGALDDGVYKSEDGGTTFKPLGTIGHIDLVSVDFTDPARKTILAGAHETKQKLFLSVDGGASFTDIGPTLPAGSHFSSAPLVLDPKRFLLGACGWGDGTCGVFASDDAGQSWKSTSSESPAGAPLVARDGLLVWPTIWGSGAIVSDDKGQSWTKVMGPHAGSPIELPDGRIAAAGGDHVIVSSDGGKTWTNIGEPFPYQPAGLTYSPSERAFFIWRNDCMDAVLDDAVMSAGL